VIHYVNFVLDKILVIWSVETWKTFSIDNIPVVVPVELILESNLYMFLVKRNSTQKTKRSCFSLMMSTKLMTSEYCRAVSVLKSLRASHCIV